jgi:hypothetical protein
VGIKRLHLQLAAKRRWQSELAISTGNNTDQYWQISPQQKRWSAQPVSSKLKDLP